MPITLAIEIGRALNDWYRPSQDDALPNDLYERADADNQAKDTRRINRLALLFSGKTTQPDAFPAIKHICRTRGLVILEYENFPTFLPLAFQRKRLEEWLSGQWLHWRHGMQEIVLIGHGHGGLLARAVVESRILMEVPQMSLITIGTPHQSCFRDLPDQDERYATVPFLNIMGGYDRTVPPSRTFHPQAEGAFFDMGHATLLSQPEPLQAIAHFLEHGRPTAQISRRKTA